MGHFLGRVRELTGGVAKKEKISRFKISRGWHLCMYPVVMVDVVVVEPVIVQVNHTFKTYCFIS